MLKSLFYIIFFTISFSSYAQTTKEEMSFLLSGLTKFRNKDYHEAISDFNVFLTQYPTGPKSGLAYFNRGWSKTILKDYTSAILDYNSALELESQNVLYYEFRGNAKSYLEDYDGAIKDFLQIQILDPENKTAYYRIGILYKLQGKHFEAIKFFNLALEFNYTPLSDCYYQRGVAKSNLNDSRGAIMDFTKALEYNPNLPECYYRRGVEKLHLEDRKGAILDITKYIVQSPNGESIKFAYSQRGLAKIGLNQKESGCLDFSKSGELGYEDAYDLIKEFCN